MSTSERAVPDPAGPPSPVYPVAVEISYPDELNRWLPLVKWLLVIPHFFVLVLVGFAAAFVVLFAFFAVLFTKRIPRELFELMVPGLRWNLRGKAYAYFTTERYPPWIWG